jgi:hypothetical protein
LTPSLVQERRDVCPHCHPRRINRFENRLNRHGIVHAIVTIANPFPEELRMFKRSILWFVFAMLAVSVGGSDAPAEPSITIYNGNLAVVRQTFDVELTDGVTEVAFSRATASVQPDSVVLRSLDAARPFKIVEQNYRNDPVTEALLLKHFEGKTIDFRVERDGGARDIVRGRILRSGYKARGRAAQPMVEVDERIVFELPGKPLFPSLSDDAILHPTLTWKLRGAPGKVPAEVAYLTGGFTWKADYNVVLESEGGRADIGGWVTLTNTSGTQFEGAHIKLIAGAVNAEIEEEDDSDFGGFGDDEDEVVEKSFDEYHLYTLPGVTTLRDEETKQVAFMRAENVRIGKRYIYGPWGSDDRSVSVWRIIENAKANNLGIPLPGGKVRFYRKNDDGQVEFVGENEIEHSPDGETLELYTGDSFDITGKRTLKKEDINLGDGWWRRTVEIELSNAKETAEEVEVREHLWWSNWKIAESNFKPERFDAETVKFIVPVPAKGKAVLTYTAEFKIDKDGEDEEEIDEEADNEAAALGERIDLPPISDVEIE